MRPYFIGRTTPILSVLYEIIQFYAKDSINVTPQIY